MKTYFRPLIWAVICALIPFLAVSQVVDEALPGPAITTDANEGASVRPAPTAVAEGRPGPPSPPSPPESRDRLVLSSKQSVLFEGLSASIRNAGTTAADFNNLRSLRNTVQATIQTVRNELLEAERQVHFLPSSIDIEASINNENSALLCAKDNECTQWITADISYLSSNIRRFENDLELTREAEREIPQARTLLSDLERLSDELDRKINDALNRDIVEQQFKTSVSLYFTAIVGVMIVLFFALLFFDEKIRNSLFSSPSAIQFVTLFSVVIAIILFGITGILQDKELSALLGGLSGYILGRYSNDTPANTAT